MIPVLILLSTILISFVIANWKPRKYPPGPISFPLVGSFPYFASYTNIGVHKLFVKWAQVYGPIFGVRFGQYPVVVLCSPSLIRKAWSTPSISGRVDLPGLHLHTDGHDGNPKGLAMSSGPIWAEQRKFFLKQMRSFGFGKRSMESIIMEEVHELIDGIRKEGLGPIETTARFNAATMNSLWLIVAGIRSDHKDPQLVSLVRAAMELQGTQAAGAVLFIPSLAKVFPGALGWSGIANNVKILHDFAEKLIQEREVILKSWTDDNHTAPIPETDFTWSYMAQIQRTTEPSSTFYGENGRRHLRTVLVDMLLAGGETSASALCWAFLYLAAFQDVQEKVVSEIKTLINSEGSRSISLEDREKMAYTQAMINEVLRMASNVPLGAFHRALETTELDGYLIPKDTLLISNVYGIHMDPKYWGDPEVFRPERFINPDGKIDLRNNEAFIPFSCGKRVCVGETLARDEIFLIMTNILKEFHVRFDPGTPSPSLIGMSGGFVVAPNPHKLIFEERHIEKILKNLK